MKLAAKIELDRKIVEQAMKKDMLKVAAVVNRAGVAYDKATTRLEASSAIYIAEKRFKG